MRLMPPDAYADVFEPLVGKRIGFIISYGNVGDDLIHMATIQLLAEYGISWTVQDPAGPVEDDVEELVFSGGGNMGRRYQNNWDLRGQALKLGLPMTILPQTYNSPEDRPYKRVYVRERMSMKYCPGATLAPDLALGLDYSTDMLPSKRLGVFRRRDAERTSRNRWFFRDPAKRCSTPEEYLELAARYERIVTDRLHFAISGLIVGRDVTILPNAYFKNEAMYEMWLKDLGCHFSPVLNRSVRSRRAA